MVQKDKRRHCIQQGMYPVLSLQVYLNRTGLNKDIFEVNQGRDLKGQMILEVPVQKKPIPQNVINYADKLRIKIRNTNNKLYN
ncbi:hypothetical protein [Segatella oulorum]|uniref:hypothetical protein n=1 Tax=Segatella oulorum TaxID=28136 RepID=UPI0028E935D0|nr:hypothetical protein [Segatella oulorum]